MANEMTVVQIERILARKRARLDGLVKRRERLQKKLDAVEGRIQVIGGRAEGAGGGRKRRRPKNDLPLIAVVKGLLSDHKKGLTLKDLAAKVLATGYKTYSDKFENTLYQCLYNNDQAIVHDAETRSYRLKAAARVKKSDQSASRTTSA